ncbi:MAG: tyrosine-type recombinase/integrase [Verrucomicrobia bacterium]|nr:tyrosine-type recombinase/integrase [Verrucomicrobiota bacterium]
MDKSFHQVSPPHLPGLEHWYRRRNALRDFQRGPLGPHFDGFAASLRVDGYGRLRATAMLGTCRRFNLFVIQRGLSSLADVSESLIEAFLHRFRRGIANVRSHPRVEARGYLKRLFRYLTDTKAFIPSPKPIVKPYGWILNAYLQNLRDEDEAAPATIRRETRHIAPFLEALREYAQRRRFHTLQSQAIEAYLTRHLKGSPHHPIRLSTSLRRFFCYCARHGHTQTDFSALIPTARRYRLASLPKGADDSALTRLLRVIDRGTPVGARNYAIVLLLIAYGIRAISAAELLLDDIDWQRSHITFRPQKGGKEVIVPLLEPIGEAIIRWLRQRYSPGPFREVFLGVRAPHRPLTVYAISEFVHRSMVKAGFTMAHCGTRTLRHSWAIRALAHNSSIKAIADILGHRHLGTTFIYAKVDLMTLREVALPWPQTR